jgi:hypothetical protein
LLALCTGCGSGLYPPGGDGLPPGAGIVQGTGGVAPVPGTTGAATPAFVRVAHLSADAGPLDVCLRTTGTSGWPGGLALGSGHGGGGLVYPALSGYVPVPSGAPLDVRLAAAGTDCTTGNRLADLDSIGPFVAGKLYSVAAVGLKAGSGGNALAAVVFKDDVAPDAANIKLRFIHAAPALSGAVDVVAEAARDEAQPSATLFADVAYGQIADVTLPANAQLSAKGYATLATVPAAIGVRVDAGGVPAGHDALFVAAPPLVNGEVYSVFAIGAATAHALICVDTNASAATTPTASCTKI